MADESVQDEAAESRPWMPVDELIREAIPDPDYADGDNPGWFSGQWNEDTRELLIRYEVDKDIEDAPYRSTEHVFRLGAQERVDGPTLGEVAYARYMSATRGLLLASMGPLPAWGELEPELQAAWQATADAVRVAC